MAPIGRSVNVVGKIMRVDRRLAWHGVHLVGHVQGHQGARTHGALAHGGDHAVAQGHHIGRPHRLQYQHFSVWPTEIHTTITL